MITFEKMCDRCFRQMYEGEPMYAFKFVDDKGAEKVYKGHAFCLNEIVEILTELYGAKEQSENDNK